MQISFIDVLISVLSLLILIIPGYILGKAKILPEGATSACSTVVLYICQSALVFMCFQKYSYSAEIGLNMLIVFGIAVVLHLLMMLFGKLCLRCESEAKQRVLRFATVFGNCGFMGLPFLQTLFAGSDVLGELLIYGAVVIATFNILNWTFGVYIMTGDRKQISLKKIICNPVIIFLVLGAVLFFVIQQPLVTLCEQGTVGYSLVSKLMSSLGLLSDMVTPLSMIVIGLRLSSVKITTLFVDKYAYLVSAVKLIVASAITILVVIFLPIAEEIKYVSFLLLSMPCATSSVLFAVHFNGDGDFASVCVLQSTILSILTIPLMFLAFNALLGIL